jgi:prepilin-type N-terminal cleavage/methylation domain-containing protein
MSNLSLMSTALRRTKQAGFTLLEVTVVLVIGALLIGGALALFSGASSAQASNQLLSDLTSVRSSVKSTFYGQGGYGTANLNQVLVNAGRVPSTITVTAGTPPTLTHGVNSGTMTIVGATNNYNITLTNIPTEICLSLLSNSQGFNQITVNSAAAITAFPISPATASTSCSTTSSNSIVFRAS